MARQVWLLLFLYLIVTVCSANEICSGRCLWINKLLERRQLPLNGDLILNSDEVHTYCYRGYSEYTLHGFLHQWHEMLVTVTGHRSDGITVTLGNSSQAAVGRDADIRKNYSNKTNTLHFLPFGVSCIGVRISGVREAGYELEAEERVALKYVVSLVIGLVLFFGASSMCRNVYLYYGTGVSIGILASVLILLYVFSRFVPKKNVLGLGFLLTGYTVVASFFYWLGAYAQEAVLAHWEYAVAYVCIAGLISFAVLYWMGPASSRTLDLIQWTVQLCGLVLIFCASPLHYVSGMAVALSLLLYTVPYRYNPLLRLLSLPFSFLACLLSPLASCVCRLNPLSWFRKQPKIQLLTMEEYDEQGRVETAKALGDLREYCRGQGNDMWRKVSQLKSPRRFTEFLSGEDHVSPDERVGHDWSFVEEEEDSGSDTVDYSEEEGTPPSHRSSLESSTSSHTPPSPSTDHYSPVRPQYYSPRPPSSSRHHSYSPSALHYRRH